MPPLDFLVNFIEAIIDIVVQVFDVLVDILQLLGLIS